MAPPWSTTPNEWGRCEPSGIDETSFLSADREHSTIYATGLVDLRRRQMIDMVEGNSAADLRRWCAGQDPAWLGDVRVVATDLAESYRAGISPTSTMPPGWPTPSTSCGSPTGASTRCAGGSRTRRSAIAAASTIRSIGSASCCSKGTERLDERGQDRLLLGLRIGDPHDELLGAWLAKESVRDVYLTDDPKEATVLLDKAIVGCRADEVDEIRSLGDTLKRWRKEILNHHRTGASNGPTEGLNFCVKQVKRAGRGFTCFEHYRLRVLLHAGGVTWPRRPSPPRIRTRSPQSNA